MSALSPCKFPLHHKIYIKISDTITYNEMRESIDREKIYKKFNLNNNRYQIFNIHCPRNTNRLRHTKGKNFLQKLTLMPQYGSTSADTLAKDTYTCVQYRRLKRTFAPPFLFPLMSVRFSDRSPIGLHLKRAETFAFYI